MCFHLVLPLIDILIIKTITFFIMKSRENESTLLPLFVPFKINKIILLFHYCYTFKGICHLLVAFHYWYSNWLVEVIIIEFHEIKVKTANNINCFSRLFIYLYDSQCVVFIVYIVLREYGMAWNTRITWFSSPYICILGLWDKHFECKFTNLSYNVRSECNVHCLSWCLVKSISVFVGWINHVFPYLTGHLQCLCLMGHLYHVSLVYYSSL